MPSAKFACFSGGVTQNDASAAVPLGWLVPDVEEGVQNALQNCSGGHFDKFFRNEFSGVIPHYTFLTINIWVVKIVNIPPLLI